MDEKEPTGDVAELVVRMHDTALHSLMSISAADLMVTAADALTTQARAEAAVRADERAKVIEFAAQKFDRMAALRKMWSAKEVAEILRFYERDALAALSTNGDK